VSGGKFYSVGNTLLLMGNHYFTYMVQ
jgi:hypothetical protein